jgi:hypothetical protein
MTAHVVDETKTPDYLARHWRTLLRDELAESNKYKQKVLLLGNSTMDTSVEFLKERGYKNVGAMDVSSWAWGKAHLPIIDRFADAILVYSVFGNVLAERRKIIVEIERIASARCTLMIDLAAHVPETRILPVQAELIEAFDWTVLDNRKARCILQR